MFRLLRLVRDASATGTGLPTFPMRALLMGIVLTMAMATFGAWNTWIGYRGLREISTVELRLDRLNGTIVHLDEVLTMSARMCAITGEPSWEARYRRFEPSLDAAIKETIQVAPEESVRKAALRLDTANVRLVEMEHESFDLVRDGRREEARRLLYSTEYEEQKGIYAQAINDSTKLVGRRVDEQLRRLSGRAMIGVVLTLAALIALGFAWARVLALVRHSVAERVTLQRQLEDAVRARDEFLSIASHELKTPLTTLKLQMDRLTGGPKRAHLEGDVPGFASKLTTVERQVSRLSTLVDALLDTSRITSGRLALTLEDDVDLSEVIRETLARFKDELTQAACEVQVRGIGAPILGRWDRLRLEQVLSNLLANSLKYGAGKPIEIEADANESIVQLAVRDHGIGISPAKQAQIFGRFERAVSQLQYGGFGLGLWIVRQIATAMQGEVSVMSRPGEGATFRVALPRRVADAASSHASL